MRAPSHQTPVVPGVVGEFVLGHDFASSGRLTVLSAAHHSGERSVPNTRTRTLASRGSPMLAMTYRGPHRVRVVCKPIPEIEHPRDAIVRVTRACICGSDLHLYHGLMPDTRVGQTFGHEFVGVVEEVGSNVHTVKPGDRVLVPFNIFCGECYFCRKGLFSSCHNANP